MRRFPLVLLGVGIVLLISTTVSTAQLEIIPTATPTPRPPTPEPTLTPAPTPEETPDPVPSDVPIPGEPEKSPDEKKTPKPEKTDGEDVTKKLTDELPEGLEEELVVPVFPRTRPRNTVRLVGLLEPLTDTGLSLEQVLVEGMGRFPVAGLAHYFDDWLNPRFTPKPHLHHGLDIFADFGTPIRAPDRGVITDLPDHGAGGTAVWIRSEVGVSYYFAHMLERVEGIEVGQRVDTGTVLGFVGDTGNAQGGTPHLHFEIHPGGGEAIPPKPTVDAWLDEAEQIAPQWVEARRADVRAKRQILGSSSGSTTGSDSKEIETSMLLTLLDPVGGSVGMLPSLELKPRPGGAVSDRLLAQLIRQRVGGRLFLPSEGLHLRD